MTRIGGGWQLASCGGNESGQMIFESDGKSEKQIAIEN
jgi:hypothetical protein